MPAATLPSYKRALADSTKAHSNAKATLPSPSAAKRRKLDVASSPTKKFKSSQNGPKLGSSQPKSQFEEEVLEKLTQDISGLKQKNSEKDQHWDRPSLDDFDSSTDSLCFQQIEAEEGTLHGGKTTVKLFGVTEVRASSPGNGQVLTNWHSDWSLCPPPCHRLPALFICCRSCFVRKYRLSWLQSVPRDPACAACASNTFRADGYAGEFVRLSRKSKESIFEDYGHRSKIHQ